MGRDMVWSDVEECWIEARSERVEMLHDRQAEPGLTVARNMPRSLRNWLQGLRPGDRAWHVVNQEGQLDRAR